MKVDIIDVSKNKIGKLELPQQFKEEFRPDIIARAVLALQSHRRQKYGVKHDAGKRASAVLSKRRRDYKGSYGIGISRTPRKIISRQGMRFNWVGAFAPNTVGGRKAHPPKSGKNLYKRINNKERKRAIRSAISATMARGLVSKRGHIIPDNFPFIVDGKIEDLKKTSDVLKALEKIGFKDELKRTNQRKIRSGKGKLRGRKYKARLGPLIVVSENSEIIRSAKNIPGVDIINVRNLNAEILAPGTMAGRLTLWTKKAIETLQKERVFLN